MVLEGKSLTEVLLLDLARCFAVLVEGLVFTGPGLHFLYTKLESFMPSRSSTRAALFHVAVDEFIFDPMFVLLFFVLCGSLEGKSFRGEVIPQIKSEYWSALKGGWAVSLLFLPLEFSTFRYLPLEFRVLVVNLTDVAWTAVVSFYSHLVREKKQAMTKQQQGGGKSLNLKAIPTMNVALASPPQTFSSTVASR